MYCGVYIIDEMYDNHSTKTGRGENKVRDLQYM